MRNVIFLSFSFFFSLLSATELAPWFGIDKALEWRPLYLFQTYSHIDHNGKRVAINHSNDNLFALALSFASDSEISAQMEIEMAQGTDYSFEVNSERMTLRYLFLDDLLGDIASVAAGFSLAHVHPSALHHPSFFYHAPYEGEIHLAIGKEQSCNAFWMQRYWGVVALGGGIRSSPWMRAELHWEKNWWDRQRCAFFLNSLWGFGSRHFDAFDPFRGYAFIGHRSIDLGAEYSYFLESMGWLAASYSYRLYARNGPVDAHRISVSLLIPFSF